MTHIWQGRRSTEWLTATPARGCSLILLRLCTIALAGWIAASLAVSLVTLGGGV